ncbi:putative tellurite resistance protein B-like protein [Flavobacterium sp. CG_23.5]|uniref:tellurite resistance TerB family protein n=1 Tax=Flavobacterium sp. CG_23.5 TaxID=2760708 RepID=UPI001AE11338|nr:tellurite resistance TerB family protein [Flavobacterium sp. CG_23.5]MBP2282455.1 putative tellurite resistance protein B-like protein [Flavobacterium sp. CG_23.5]
MNSFEDKNNSKQNPVTSEFEAWVGILYSCISADNQITDSETASLSRLLHSKTKFMGIDIGPLYAKSFHLRTEMGQLKYISDCCEWIKDEDKETVFALALEVLLADGILEKEEKNIIEVLSKLLKMDLGMASKIIEVIFLKNKGNVKGI